MTRKTAYETLYVQKRTEADDQPPMTCVAKLPLQHNRARHNWPETEKELLSWVFLHPDGGAGRYTLQIHRGFNPTSPGFTTVWKGYLQQHKSRKQASRGRKGKGFQFRGDEKQALKYWLDIDEEEEFQAPNEYATVRRPSDHVHDTVLRQMREERKRRRKQRKKRQKRRQNRPSIG